MGIVDVKILYYHGVVEGNVDKKISTLEYNNRTVYYCFNNPFKAEFCGPYLNLPPINIDDRTRPQERAQYTQYLIPDTIYVAYESSFSTLTNPYDSPDLLPSDYPNCLYVMKEYDPFKGRFNRGKRCIKHGHIICYKNTRFY